MQNEEVELRYGRGRAPHGARGLKFKRALGYTYKETVAPHTGRVD